MDAYTVTLGAAQTAGGLTVEEGTVSLAELALTVGTGTLTVGSGAKLSIPLTTNLLASAGANLNLNGGTFRNTSNGVGSTFVSALVTINWIQFGTVETTNTGTNSAIYAGTIKGVGGTLTKTGSGEFRFQGAGTGTTTFSKLVVNQGLFRLGNIVSNNFETGLGQQCLRRLSQMQLPQYGRPLGQATISRWPAGGVLRLGTGGGGFFTSAASLVVPSPITGRRASN